MSTLVCRDIFVIENRRLWNFYLSKPGVAPPATPEQRVKKALSNFLFTLGFAIMNTWILAFRILFGGSTEKSHHFITKVVLQLFRPSL
jgi:hypothetical protein